MPTPRSMDREASNGPKLRPLFWTAVQQVPTESVWADLEPPAPFDQSLLEKRFALAEARSLAQTRKGPGAPETPRKRLRVLDDRTSQLLAIAFNRLPPPERLAMIVDALEDFPDGLPAEAVLALHAAASDQKEALEQLRHLDVPEAELASQLDLPERYLWVVGTKPAFAAKLACGALIVGPARELGDLQQSFQQVCFCCQEFRNSRLIRKCISTSLAVGNIMNRGTARSGARAIVLPDSLQKLDELRGAQEMEELGADVRGPTLLDFVAQALVDEATTCGRTAKDLQADAEELRTFARTAQSVSLEDAEASCMKVCSAASRAKQSLADLPDSASVHRLANRVRVICEEADKAAKLVENAKHELALTQQWSSAKGNTKGNDWFAAWASFLEQLSRALGRARVPAAPSAAAATTSVPAVADEIVVPKPAPTQIVRPPLHSIVINNSNNRAADDVPKAVKVGRPVPPLFLGGLDQQPAAEPAQLQRLEARLPAEPVRSEQTTEPLRCVTGRPGRPRPTMIVDDDVRMEDVMQMLAAKNAAEAPQVAGRQQPRPQTRVPCLYGFDAKENRF